MVVKFKPSFLKKLIVLPTVTKLQVDKIIREFERVNNSRELTCDIKAIKGRPPSENYYRIGIGGYRIGIQYLKPEVILISSWNS